MTWLGVGGKIYPCNSVISSYPIISSYFVKFRETFAENEWIKDYYLLGVWLAPWHQSLRTPIIIINLVKRFDQLYFCIELLYFFLKFFNFIYLFLLFIKPSIYLQIYLTAGSSNSIILFASKGFHAFRWDSWGWI